MDKVQYMQARSQNYENISHGRGYDQDWILSSYDAM